MGAIPAPPPTKIRSVSGASRNMNTPYGPVRPGPREPVADLQLLIEILREQPVRIDLDHELELPAFPGRRVRHRERPDLVRAGHGDVHVLPREELEIDVRRDQAQDQVPQVVGYRVVGYDLGLGLQDRQP